MPLEHGQDAVVAVVIVPTDELAEAETNSR
jgi:hypothetical protein